MMLSDRVVDTLDLGEEGIELGGEGMERVPERQVATGAKQTVRSAKADRWIKPVPGGRRVDEVKRPRFAFPVLKLGDVDLDGKAG